jgi:competence protein ComEA
MHISDPHPQRVRRGTAALVQLPSVEAVRGESDRVAARVRALLNEYGRESTSDTEPASAPAVRAPTHLSWQSLLTRVPVRLDPGRSGALAVGLAVVAAAIGTGLWLLAQRPHTVPIAASGGQLSSAPTPVGTGTGESSAAATGATVSPSAALLVVDVAGKVRRPGLYRLPDGARVDDAIRAAGGPLRGVDLSSLNLAARVVDGQQILVGRPAPGLAGGAPGAGTGATTESTAPVSLNTATLEQLETLPGIGPVLAQNIIDWRTANGGFASVEQLTEVSGIGDVTFAELQPLVTL